MSRQFEHTLTTKEIGGVKKSIIGILDYLHTSKYRILPEDYRQLCNHLQYSLTTLTNMDNVLLVEKSDPYNLTQAHKTLTYNQDGTTRFVDKRSLDTTGDGWEQQFDKGLLQNPPCFMMPPQSLTHIPQIRKAAFKN